MTNPWESNQPGQNPQQPSSWQPAQHQPPQQHQPPTGRQQWAQPAPAARSPRRSGPPMLLGVVIGLVIAVIAGAVLVLTDVLGFGGDDTAAGPDTTPIALPAELGDVRDQFEVLKEKSSKNADKTKARLDHTYALTGERYAKAFAGAVVAVRSYIDPELEFMPTVIAIRAASPGLFTGVVYDPADTGMAVVPNVPEVKQEGDVTCYVQATQAVMQGKTVDPEDLRTTVCRRANDSLTVYVHGNGEGSAGYDRMVAVTNAAFDAVSGASRT